jgi:hypothetical protein
MSQPQSFKDNLTDWQSLVENLKPHLTDMPALAADHAALTAVVTQAHALESQQDLHKANLRDVNQQRNTIAAQGRTLRSRLATGLKLTLGSQSERLLEFGVNPRPRVTRAKRLSTAEKAEKAAAAATQAKAMADAEAALAAAKEQLAKAAQP